MNWLTNFVRPKIRAIVKKENVPDNLWHRCPACEQMIFHRDLEANHRVCTHCGHHMRVRPLKRLPHRWWTRKNCAAAWSPPSAMTA